MKEYIVHAPNDNRIAVEEYTSFYGETITELIRCKDCKYREYGYCNLYLSFHRLTADMDYCSDAERKEE